MHRVALLDNYFMHRMHDKEKQVSHRGL